ncbi:MAG: L-serine ammonia-lyase, iron-sulfur-dependent, subunit alpha, partial [Eubacteriales bacterium]
MIDEKIQSAYLKILEEELVMATGCTEPIALAYGASVLRELMGELPTKIHAEISGNIIKNVKSVVVPNTGGLKGIEAAVAAGIVAGKPSKQLQCIAKVSVPQQVAIAEYLKNAEIKVECLDSTRLLDIEITGYSENHVAKIHIANHHTNLVGMEKDGQAVLELAISDSAEENLTDKSLLNVATILEFANTVDVELLRPMIQRQIDCNLAIAWEGLRGEWGANVGQILLRDFGDDTKIAAKAFAAAGSDARMSGCELPVVIVSGSGNQGMTASLPVIVYAQRMG